MCRKQGKGDLPVNETQGEAEKTDGQSTTQQLCFVLGLLLFGALFMVSVTSWYVHEYRGEHFFATEDWKASPLTLQERAITSSNWG